MAKHIKPLYIRRIMNNILRKKGDRPRFFMPPLLSRKRLTYVF